GRPPVPVGAERASCVVHLVAPKAGTAAAAMRAIALLLTLALAVEGAQIVQSHPRIWLTGQMLADMNANKASGDPDWIGIKAAADAVLSQRIPKLTIASATDSNPVTFTTTEPLPWNGAAIRVYLSGASGAWQRVNNNPATEGWTATAIGTN